MQTEQLKDRLDFLTKEEIARFGIMTPQHMVEHLIITFKLSQGKISLPEKEPSPRALQAKQAILYGEMDLPKGIQAPGIGEKLLDLKYASLEEAKEQLIKSLDKYHSYFSENKDIKHYHPAFGPLNYEEWTAFHHKHFKHHFGQFGISW